jgi:hypothetical protein
VNEYGDTLAVFEIARSQSRSAAVAKVQKILARNPSTLVAVVISLDEYPRYESPSRDSSKDDLVNRRLWSDAVKRAPAFGPININGHCWMGQTTASFDIQFKNEAGLRISKGVRLFFRNWTTPPLSSRLHQSIIPKSLNADTDASAALKELWGKLVQTVAGEDAIPVEFSMDWDEFREDVRKSLGRVAYERIIRWVRSIEEPKRRAQVGLQAQGGKRARHV